MATQSERLKARKEAEAKRKRERNKKPLFDGKKTRMYKGFPYPAEMLKYNKRGRAIGVKMTTDSQGPNPRPDIDEIERSIELNKISDSNKGSRNASVDAGKRITVRPKVKSVDAGIQTRGTDSAEKALTDSTKKATENLKSKVLKAAKAIKGTTLGQTRRQQRRADREDRVARRRAGRTGRRNFERTGQRDSQAQFDANVEAEKEQIRNRRARRNQFLRDFASQLAKGEQAKKPGTEYDGQDSDFYNLNKTKQSDEDQAKSKEVEVAENAYKSKFESIASKDNNYMNSLQIDLPKFTSVSPNNKIEEDSTPLKAMRKAYNKKRGF